MSDDFHFRYSDLMEGNIIKFSLKELTYLLQYLNCYKINTLCVQQSGNDFYCSVDQLTVNKYREEYPNKDV